MTAPRTVAFDATRLFMRALHASPTGVDRVTEAYGRWLLGRPDVRLVPVCTVGGVITPLSRRRFAALLERRATAEWGGRDEWPRLVEALGAHALAGQGMRPGAGQQESRLGKWARYGRFGMAVAANARTASLRPGSLYINVSHYGLEQSGLLDHLAARGVQVAAMIHDLIPILHPEYCSPTASGWHLRRLEGLLRHKALIIANSRSTAADVTAFARRLGRPGPRVRVAPLGLEDRFLAPAERLHAARPYFVCVGTIEPRKNVAFLLTVWRRLSERLGDSTPPLVLAGRRGWENEAIIDLLERSPPIRRFVHEISGLEDDCLAALIRGAQALLAPSFTEGYNLPVAEAAALGTPVIASDIPVHRELARHAMLLDPLDGPAWLEAIAAAAIRRPDSPPRRTPSWTDHFAAVERALGWTLGDHGSTPTMALTGT